MADLFDRSPVESSKRARSTTTASQPLSSLPPPLADRMRPRTLEEFVGQEHLVGVGTGRSREGKLLTGSMDADRLPSIIFWGPPGSGKTTLARLIAQASRCHFVFFSAVLAGVKEVREVIKEAKQRQRINAAGGAAGGKRTILFVDEIHRFNRSQQDAFLPHVEDGTIILMGATTENPSFAINAPLLSRCQVVVLKPLGRPDVVTILRRALDDLERGLGAFRIEAEPKLLEQIADWAEGDARRALNILEAAVALCPEAPQADGGQRRLAQAAIKEAAQQRLLLFDKDREEHYNVISAFIKSMRGSDPDAAVYWLARMLEAGEEPLFVARRMIIFASEDVGNADPRALIVAVSAHQAFQAVGWPEGWIPLSQAATYLATAPKSNASYRAYRRAKAELNESGSLPVPLHLRNAPTELMRREGYGEDYQYPHDFPGHVTEQDYLPERLKGRRYYEPTDEGEERRIKERLEQWRKTMAARPPSKPERPSK
jgi:putative ATPase